MRTLLLQTQKSNKQTKNERNFTPLTCKSCQNNLKFKINKIRKPRTKRLNLSKKHAIIMKKNLKYKKYKKTEEKTHNSPSSLRQGSK